MKTILLTLVLALTAEIMTAQTEISPLDEAQVETTVATPTLMADQTPTTTQETSITVNVPVASDHGSVFFSLHSQETFMRNGLANLESEIIDGSATVTFENIPVGTYGIVLYHDKNGNKKMDFEPNGMPKEMYGVSNNVMSFRPPMWSDAKFEVATAPNTLEIRL
jgi:uncharacterized protein (DUF2141 family)